jgi:hypothetical protein
MLGDKLFVSNSPVIHIYTLTSHKYPLDVITTVYNLVVRHVNCDDGKNIVVYGEWVKERDL